MGVLQKLMLASVCAIALVACDNKPAEPTKPVEATAPAKPVEPAATTTPAAPAPAADLPKEVTDLAGRIETCVHFAGEEPYDKDRAAEIKKAMDDAKCDTAEAEEAAMRTKYAGNAAVLKRLDDAKNF